MFGYVTACKKHMSPEDFETFNAYYCGVCKATGRIASQCARLGLSYDITFLAIVISSVMQDYGEVGHGGCIAHPFKDKPHIIQCGAVDYAAAMGVILMYLKLRDDVADDKSLMALVLSSVLHGGVSRAQKGYEEQYSKITDYLHRLSVLENENCGEIDKCADCFAKILQTLFAPDFITDSEQRRILSWVGYNTGRWIYILDAYNDMIKDRKFKRYNPFLASMHGDFDEYRKNIGEQLNVSLTFTLENIASGFDLLDIGRNKAIIENIVYIGMRAKQDSILSESGKAEGS